MYETDPGRNIALIIIGVYVGVAATIAFNRYRAEQSEIWTAGAKLEQRVFNLENPQPDDAAES